jgi:hypothetical protein
MLALGLQVLLVMAVQAHNPYQVANKLDLRPTIMRILSHVRYMLLQLPIRQEVAAAHLRDLHHILGQCGIHFWLIEGTALGAVREGRVIPTDTDIDIGIRSEDRPTLERRALPLLQRRGFVVWKRAPHLISIVKSHLCVDMMCARPGGHCIDMPCDQYLPLVRPDQLQRVRMYGLEFWAPPIAYLERVYGQDWRTPRHQWKPTYRSE